MESEPLQEVDLGGNRAARSQFVLAFNDLTYNVRQPKKKAVRTPSFQRGRVQAVPYDIERPPKVKTLLDRVSGEARQGEILAILGPSGSGKSTLLDALANRIARESLQGTITLNGERLKSGALLKVISTYVMQDDMLYPMLTVEETLMFAAEFRLPKTWTTRDKKKRVEVLIDQLGLKKAAKTIVGDEGHRGVSGGERRRVSIGVDIVHDPIILFLDEPISGLDSTSAYMVIKVLHEIAEKGSLVIMSIHQPSSRILNLLDRMIFLSRGRTVYYGPPGSLPKYFSEFGMPIPREQNPAEFTLDLVHKLQEDEQTDPTGIRRLVGFCKSWGLRNVSRREPSTLRTSNGMSLNEVIFNCIPHARLVNGTIPNYANNPWTEMWVLMKRSYTNSWRLPEIFISQLGAVIFTGVLCASLFWKLEKSSTGVTERLGFFSVAMSTMFYIVVNALPAFLDERYIFYRETSHNAYRRSSYVISRAIGGFPALVVYSVVFAGVTYFPVGLDGGFNGFLYYTICSLAAFWSGSGFANFLSGILTEFVSGFAVVMAALRFFLTFCGFYINRDRIPHYWLWFHYMSLMKYPYQGAMQNEFGNNSTCFSQGVQLFDNTIVEKAATYDQKAALLPGISMILGRNITTQTCMTTGPDILKQNAVNDLSKWDEIWVQIAWGFLFRFLFYIALKVGSNNKRR
ncbi:ABC transporter G family member 2 [Rhynchospora pubera]|uniref:ABC transporter G family member 5 n=1 Tax=Rhynchospora pubera TaxID=906938 RepID=A0AAV8BSJ1_9POAL|nr:ABC transporter G family member 2 [Rhynchospora pubera]